MENAFTATFAAWTLGLALMVLPVKAASPVVSNGSDAVSGDTSSSQTLIANSGLERIPLPESLVSRGRPSAIDSIWLYGKGHEPMKSVQGMRARSSSAAVELAAGAPTITDVTPTSGAAGTRVTLQGSNLLTDNTVRLTSGGRSFTVDSPAHSENGTTLQFRISTCPSHAPMCPGIYILPGVYDVSVTNPNGTSNSVKFTVTSQ